MLSQPRLVLIGQQDFKVRDWPPETGLNGQSQTLKSSSPSETDRHFKLLQRNCNVWLHDITRICILFKYTHTPLAKIYRHLLYFIQFTTHCKLHCYCLCNENREKMYVLCWCNQWAFMSMTQMHVCTAYVSPEIFAMV